MLSFVSLIALSIRFKLKPSCSSPLAYFRSFVSDSQAFILLLGTDRTVKMSEASSDVRIVSQIRGLGGVEHLPGIKKLTGQVAKFSEIRK